MPSKSITKPVVVKAPYTASLRTLLEKTRRSVSGKLPSENHFSANVQLKLLEACNTFALKRGKDQKFRMDAYLELIDFLVLKGVEVPQILGEIRCHTSKSSTGVSPRALAVRLHFAGHEDRSKAAKKKKTEGYANATPQFMEPVLTR